jgi:hypothetical protein
MDLFNKIEDPIYTPLPLKEPKKQRPNAKEKL